MRIKDNYLKLNIRNKRTIVTSDVHGRPDLLEQLLKNVDFSHEDILIINGDIIDKGPDSIQMITYVERLMAQGNVYVTLGNCDKIFDELEEAFLYDYMAYRYTIVHEMLKQLGKTLDDYTSQGELAKELRTKFEHLHNVMKDLPLMIETEDYIFVHAGVDEDYMETTERDALNMPFFYNQPHQLEKTVIVGHFPACNFVEQGVYHHNIKIHPNHNTIAIDGGNQVKTSGQLDGLIIEADGTLHTTFVDDYEQSMVIQSFDPGFQTPHSFTYPDYAITAFEGDEYFTYCEHGEHDGCMVKTEFIDFEAQRLKDDYTDYFHAVEAGAFVSVIHHYKGYVLIKKNGIVGFVPEEVLE